MGAGAGSALPDPSADHILSIMSILEPEGGSGPSPSAGGYLLVS